MVPRVGLPLIQLQRKKSHFGHRLGNNKFPDNENAGKAEEHINKCMKILVGNEFYVGLFYYKSKHYKAALNRFKAVLSRYPDVGVHRDALLYIALCKDSLAKQNEKAQNK